MNRRLLPMLLAVGVALAGCGGSNHTARWRADWKRAVEKGEGNEVGAETKRHLIQAYYDEYVEQAHANASERREAEKVEEQEQRRPEVEAEAEKIKQHREAEHLANERESGG